MNAAVIAQYRAFIVDMDGVLWTGDTPLPGLRAFFAALRRTGRKFVLATNNATRTAAQYVERAAGFGVELARTEIITSAEATARAIADESGAGTRVFCIGEVGLAEALVAERLALHNDDVRYVIVGMDRSVDWSKLATAALNIRAGARFIGTNPDVSFPTERGIVPGNGAILAALEAATGVSPRIIGKPEPVLYEQALARMCAAREETLVIGDRLDTDIAGAIRAGLSSLLVLTGITSPAMVAAGAVKPTHVLPALADLTPLLD
ncbi:MAG: HAD-IIA family hydrolase [Anaerolineales bacterium]